MEEQERTRGAGADAQPPPPPPPVVALQPTRLTEFGPFAAPPNLPAQTEVSERPALTGEQSAPAPEGAGNANGTKSAEPRETMIALRISERERAIIDALARIRSDDGLIQAPTMSDYIRWLVDRDNRQVLEAITKARNV